VRTLDQARPIFSQLVKWVNGHGMMYNNLDLHIELRNHAQLSEFIQSPTSGARGAILRTTYTKNDSLIRTEVNGVAILRGLPLTLFQGVTIHELGHAWLTVHDIISLSSLEEEGFCEMLSYLFYAAIRTTESRVYARAISENIDPVYGEGFRRVYSIVQEFGFSRLLKVLLKTKSLYSL
jgi:hypothetical protein